MGNFASKAHSVKLEKVIKKVEPWNFWKNKVFEEKSYIKKWHQIQLYKVMSMIFQKLIDNKKTDSKFCNTCEKKFARTGYYKHNKSETVHWKLVKDQNVKVVKNTF